MAKHRGRWRYAQCSKCHDRTQIFRTRWPIPGWGICWICRDCYQYHLDQRTAESHVLSLTDIETGRGILWKGSR
jgi:hypothetical protein